MLLQLTDVVAIDAGAVDVGLVEVATMLKLDFDTDGEDIIEGSSATITML